MLIVSAADKLANARAVLKDYREVGEKVWSRFNAGRHDQLWYYRTVTEEFATTRSAFRWRQLVALARVTASEYGFPAPGFADACRLLKVG